MFAHKNTRNINDLRDFADFGRFLAFGRAEAARLIFLVRNLFRLVLVFLRPKAFEVCL